MDTVTKNAQVIVRSPSSVRNLLVADDIVVWADLTGLGPGMHTVELQWEVAPERRAHIVDISPRQVTVNLEEQLSILVPVRANTIGALPFGYTQQGDPTFDVNQVTVTGPASKVQQVAAARVDIRLNGQRTSIEDDVRPVAIDADGNVVQGVTLDTQVIRVKLAVGESTAFATPTAIQP
jgi:YbbR domain-containing protein